MYQGQELLNMLYNVYELVKRYNYDMNEYLSWLRSKKKEMKYIDTKSVKGKMNLALAVCIIVLLFISLEFAVFGGGSEGLIVTTVGLIAFFTCKNMFPKVSKAAIVVVMIQLVYELGYYVSRMMTGDVVLIIIGLVFTFVPLGIGIFAVCKYLKHNRTYIDSRNKEIRNENAYYDQQCQEWAADAKMIDAQLGEMIQGWYPPDYLNMNALEFFINALRNYRADNMGDLVNLYNSQLNHEQMIRMQQEQIDITREGFARVIDGQQNIEQQLRYNNMLNMWQVFELSDIRQSVGGINQSLSNISSRI